MIHSLVQYRDGSVLAELGNPDMRTPIAHALAWPDRLDSGVAPLDLIEVGRLDFQAPDPDRFPCLRLAFEAARTGGSAPLALNAANEVAVAAFLDGRVGFPGIGGVVEGVLQSLPVESVEDKDLASLIELDERARERAEQLVGSGVY
jgi:1-deoxy-D-xylulose-5-phosphate reductoisomerase